MQKIIIGILLLITVGCTATRKVHRKHGNESGNNLLINSLIKNNLAGDGFFIQKAEVEISGKDIHQKLLASIKFNPPDTYNVSLRLRTGIEIARIFLTNDTVLANDRINRRVYKGKPAVLGRRYGFSIESMPLIFGDFQPSGKEQQIVKCENGLTEFRSYQHGMSLIYYVDCNLSKVVKIVKNSSLGSGGNEILFDDFIKAGDIVIPSEISMSQPEKDISVRIRITKIEKPWSGSAAFFPGNRYEVIELK